MITINIGELLLKSLHILRHSQGNAYPILLSIYGVYSEAEHALACEDGTGITKNNKNTMDGLCSKDYILESGFVSRNMHTVSLTLHVYKPWYTMPCNHIIECSVCRSVYVSRGIVRFNFSYMVLHCTPF
jgi:hypothetical protein